MSFAHLTTKTTSAKDLANERLQRGHAHLIDARIAAIKQGHDPGHFVLVEGPLWASTCFCGALVFVDLDSGETGGQGAKEPCPRAAHHARRSA